MKLLTSAVIALLILSSCQKELITTDEFLNAETVASDATGEREFPNCKLRRINHWFPGQDIQSVSGLFTYNKNGNPISLIYNNNGTGNPNHYFFYDNQNRLTEWRQTYQNGTIVIESHRYVYDDAGVAIRDTATFIEGDTIINVYTFTYDGQGRIVKENIKNIKNAGAPLARERNPTYTYDARGNLGVLGWKSSQYDNMINPLRLHPVFQFIFKNWSRNNANLQPKYNAMGFPQHWQTNNDVFFNATTNIWFIIECAG